MSSPPDTDLHPDPTPAAAPGPGTGRLIAVGVLALVLLVGVGVLIWRPWSSGGDFLPSIGPARIQTDTPALRREKAEAGIATCRAGTARNQLPAVTLPCFGGGPSVQLDRLSGPMVISVWAGNCGPCRKELPFFERLHTRLGDRVDVLGIDYNDPQTGLAMALLRSTGVTYPQVADPQQALLTSRPRLVHLGIPVLVLVGADGRVAYTAAGGMHSYAELAGLVQRHLGITA